MEGARLRAVGYPSARRLLELQRHFLREVQDPSEPQGDLFLRHWLVQARLICCAEDLEAHRPWADVVHATLRDLLGLLFSHAWPWGSRITATGWFSFWLCWVLTTVIGFPLLLPASTSGHEARAPD